MTERNATMPWLLVLMAAAILMITMGTRVTNGFFMSPLNTTTGLGVVKISLAMAIGQFIWGAVQPVFGALADRFGFRTILTFGALLLAAGFALTPHMKSEWGLILSIGVLSAAGAGAGSFSILIGATATRIPDRFRTFASGIINAGSSLGQSIFAPLTQFWIASFGWVSAMYALAFASLLTLPMGLLLAGRAQASTTRGDSPSVQPSTKGNMWQAVQEALRDRSYWCLHAGFFTCGFHIAFLMTHLPTEVSLCGLPETVSGTALAIIGLCNIGGSLGCGALASRFKLKYLLFHVYGLRAVIISAYLIAPKTAWTFYLFAGALGATWLATVPPTAGLVSKLFGTRYLATLFGLTLFSHQAGGFLGAWLGGVIYSRFHDYHWMWWIDIALATLAALVNLPIRESVPNTATAR